MPSALPDTNPCCSVCESPLSVAVPGAAGAAGAAGSDGDDGTDAFTTTSANFTMPAEAGDVSVSVADSTWMTPTQLVYVQNAGYMEVRSKSSAVEVTLRNKESTASGTYAENVAPTTVVASGSQISPAGLQGPAGADGTSGAPDDAGYWVSAADGDLSGEHDVSALTDGVVQHTSGVPSQAPLCTAVEGLAANGLVTRTGASTAAARTITGTAGSISVTDGDGVAGNPTLDVGANVYVAGGTDVPVTDGGTGASTAAAARDNLGFGSTTRNHALYEERQATTTDAGGFTSGAWQTRLLNTEVYDPGTIGSISSNQVTLGAGTYRFRGWAVAYQVDNHQTRLQNITAGTTVAFGTNARAGAAEEAQNHSEVSGRFTIGGSTVFELQHRCTTTKATSGFGLANSFGGTEVYSGLLIEQES